MYKKHSIAYRLLSVWITFTFFCSLIVSPAQAQNVVNLPTPGIMIPPSVGFLPAMIKGLQIHPDAPLQFDFIIDSGEDDLQGELLKEESQKLIKYFLAALTTPEEDLWVNLSPYEKDRIVPEAFGQTEMGRDLLGQDYLLKQLTATLMYPEDDLGKTFWNQVYERAYELYGSVNIPINTFNKVWIVPEKAVVYETENNTVLIIDSHLKVMLEEDYLALNNNLNSKQFGTDQVFEQEAKEISNISSEIVRKILIPAIEKEVNEGENFAPLRQMNQALILATWYKTVLKESLLGQVYVDQNKVYGVDVVDKEVKNKIYQQYLEAFKVGVYDYIREDLDPFTQQIIPRKYFSGGYTTVMYDKSTSSPISLKNRIQRVTNQTLSQLNGKAANKFRVLIEKVQSGAEFGKSKIHKITTQLFEPEALGAMASSAVGQIGKKYEIDQVDVNAQKNQLRIKVWNRAASKKKKFILGITQSGQIGNKHKNNILESVHDQDQELVQSILGLLEENISLYQFQHIEQDLLGFASPNSKLIALHEQLANHPSALFHEIGEYLQAQELLSLQLEKTTLVILAGEKEFRVFLEGETLAIAKKGENTLEKHYLLRALQRILFDQKDRQLTSKIVLEQNRSEIIQKIVKKGLGDILREVVLRREYKPDNLKKELSEILTKLADDELITKNNLSEIKVFFQSDVFNKWKKSFLNTIDLFSKAKIITSANFKKIINFLFKISLNLKSLPTLDILIKQ
ncbi:diguanylate cyclase/phosphodiesterase (GGDEF & EAL domains) with PAS/PAC sensor(s), partial [hydrothermal vent metagenome]